VPEERPLSDAAIDAAVQALSDPDRFREAEARLTRVAPQLQRILNQALQEGGWFGEAHESELLKAATDPDQDARLRALRVLVADETRMGMMIGVAVGWELARELEQERQED
jgi:HPt (histidine-containing phosphotransfer) domain-containing protein